MRFMTEKLPEGGSFAEGNDILCESLKKTTGYCVSFLSESTAYKKL